MSIKIACDHAGAEAAEQESSRQQPAAQTPPPLPSASPDWRRQDSGHDRHELPAAGDEPSPYRMPSGCGMSNEATHARLHSLHEGLLFWRQTQQRMWGDSPWPAGRNVHPHNGFIPDSSMPGRCPSLPAFPDDVSLPFPQSSPHCDPQHAQDTDADASVRDLIAARRHTAPPGPGSRTPRAESFAGVRGPLQHMRSASMTSNRTGRPGSDTGSDSQLLRRTGSQHQTGITPGGLARLSEESSQGMEDEQDRPDDVADAAEPKLVHQPSWQEGGGAGAHGPQCGQEGSLAEMRVRQRGRTGSEPGGPRRATAEMSLPPRHMSVDAIRAGVARSAANPHIVSELSDARGV